MSDGEYGSTGIDLGISIDVPDGVSITEFTNEVYDVMHEQLIEKLRKENLIQ